MILRRLLCFLFACSLLAAEEVTVDLNNPTFREGVLSTTEGGVLQGEGIRIQARCLTYTRREGVETLVAEGDLMVEYGCDILIGRRLEYDFISHTGCLYEGRIETGPWYVGAQVISIRQGGSYLAKQAFLTTCEGKRAEWGFYAQKLCVNRNGEISATNVQGRIGKIPFLWIPSFHVNINSFLDSPLQYKAEVAGIEGSRIGIRYRFFTYKDFRAFARAEYIIGRGPAGGIETEWCPRNRQGSGYTQSYVARDRSINNPRRRTRYRFAGSYEECLSEGCWARLFYDVLSDREMPTDYRLSDFNLHTARTTQASIGRVTPYWVARVRARPRVNTFQTVSQELPSVDLTLQPYCGPCGIVGMSRGSLGYWDTLFAEPTLQRNQNIRNFRSSRVMVGQTLAKPLCGRIINLLPEATLMGIHYGKGGNTLGNDPTRHILGTRWLGWIRGDLEANTRLTRLYGCYKHTIEPYAHYTAAIQPTSRNDSHPIFTSRDAYTDLHWLRFGIRQDLYCKESAGCLYHPLSFDFFTYAFLDTPTIVGQIPRLYGRLTYYPARSLEAIINAAWNLAHNQIDHFNAHFEWTLSEWAAVNLELRYRSQYAWRKANHFNFTLDTFTPEGQLLRSGLSDQRYTVLTHCFIRALPTVGIELETRHGFRRRTTEADPPRKAYNEGKLSFHILLPCRWQASFYIEHTEVDNRGGLSLTLGDAKRPPTLGRRCSVW